MPAENHSQIASFIWSICNLLRGPYKRNEYRKVILPLTVLRRFDCILAPTKPAVLKEHAAVKAKGENIVRHRLSQITKMPFYNLSRFTMAKPAPGSGLNGLLDDPNQLAPNLNSFYNAGICTYLWVLTNRKEKPRQGKVQLIDARQFWVQMEKSLGNKRRRIGDPSDKEKDPDHISELTKIHGRFKDGETRTFTEEDAITHQPTQRQRVVSKIFA